MGIVSVAIIVLKMSSFLVKDNKQNKNYQQSYNKNWK